MKPHSLICTDAEALAFHEGTKTQFRRLVKFPKRASLEDCWMRDPDGKPNSPPWPHTLGDNGRYNPIPSPFSPGSVVLVKEAFRLPQVFDCCATRDIPQTCIDFRASLDDLLRQNEAAPLTGKWRPASQMLPWAVRTRLVVTGVRVERVSDISEHDAIKEGMKPHACAELAVHFLKQQKGETWTQEQLMFADYWNARHPGSWERGYWVWVFDVRKLDEKEEA